MSGRPAPAFPPAFRRPAAPLLEEEADARPPSIGSGSRTPRLPSASARWPDPPPAMTQSIPVRSSLRAAPSSGSAETNRTAARPRRWSIRNVVPGALDPDPHPDVRRPVELRRDPAQPLRPLRQDLVRVLRRVRHDLEDRADEVDRDTVVEQVAHRVHEHEPRLLPPVRPSEDVGVQRDAEPGPRGAGVTVVLVLRSPPIALSRFARVSA